MTGTEKHIVNDPATIKRHQDMGYKVFKSVKEETQVQEASHQAKTTMKHVKNPTAGEKAAAKDIKPGVAGYRDRIAMLKSAEARGGLKKEEASQEEFTAEIKKAQDKSQGKEKADVAKPAVVAVKQESVEQVDEAKEPGFRASYGIGRKGTVAKKPETYGKKVQGKGYDKPENERKAPEGKLSMTSLMPGHSDKAARLAAVQAKGKLVKGSAQSAKQVEKGMKKEEVEQIDEIGDTSAGKQMLGAYVKKAARRVGVHASVAAQYADTAGSDTATPSQRRAASTLALHQKHKRDMRLRGVERATDRITKEEVEQIDEISVHKAQAYSDVADKRLSGIKFVGTHKRMRTSQMGAIARNKIRLAQGRGPTPGQNPVKVAATEEVEQIDERTLSEPETAEKERLVKSMKKNLAGFKQRYGERAKSVMYATATARAKENK